MKAKPVKQRIWIEGDSLRYEVGVGIGWTQPISGIEIVGEYTDPNGPYVDDYFFVFVIGPDHRFWEASFYADGRDKMLDHLGEKLGAQLSCGLAHSTDYDSRVLWPRSLEDKKLFEFVPVKADSLWTRLKYKLIPEYYYKFTSEVSECLQIEYRPEHQNDLSR
jgi:hypothetical protein